MSIESVMPCNHLIFYGPFLFPQSFPVSGSFTVSWLLTSDGQSIGSFSFSISPSNEYSWLTSFRIDWFDLAIQGTLKKSAVNCQHHSSKVSVLWCSAFFMVQISHPYMTTGKTIALTRWASLVAQLVKNLPAMRETWSWVGKIPWRRESLPTPVFWPGEFHGLYKTLGRKESDRTEQLSLSLHLTRRNFVSKVMSLLFNRLSNFITAFLPRSKNLLISWLQSVPVVILDTTG